jgi:hypothetical protein
MGKFFGECGLESEFEWDDDYWEIPHINDVS